MVSVIIPVYNTSKYLKQCISSVLSQSYSDIELIMINDGSTDNSLTVCKEFERLDSRIIVIDKKNEGVDKARFIGLKVANGEFVTFIDSDDWIEPETLRIMMDYAEKYDCDYVEVGMQRVLDKHGFIKRKYVSPVLGLIQQPELFDKYYISFLGYNILPVNIWGKLYRRDSIEKACLKPSGLKMGEDLYFNLMLFPYLNSIYLSDYIGYNYRFGGMTSRYNPTLFTNLKYLYLKKKEFINKYSYFKANDFIRYEIVNVFKSDIRQKILYKYCDKESLLLQIENELNDPVWRDVQEISNADYLKTPFVKALIQRDSYACLELMVKQVNKDVLKYNLKKIIAKLLQIA